MTVTVKHSKTNAISDWTQAQLDEQIALGNFAEGTVLADIVLPSDWNNDHTLTGVGTMAEQDANNVAITGGTATLSSVTTPSVTATTNNLTLSAISTGAVNLNTAGGTGFKISDNGAMTSYWETFGGTGTNILFANGSTANITALYKTKGTGGHQFTTAGSNSNTQLNVANTASAVNYVQVTGAATTKAPIVSMQGSDTNISMAFQPKGTGAINLAAGSSGVNISNGGTVTAITRTNVGSLYTTNPTVTISAPTTAGGVQATASCTLGLGSVLVSGGTGYTVGNVLTVVGGTFTTAAQITVSAVSGGVITAAAISNQGAYTAVPTSPASVTGGSGSGATFTMSSFINTPTITNAGSGYIEQPTITFSGGGGSGASAYATVGSVPIIRSLAGSAASTDSLSFYTPAGESVRIKDQGVTSNGYVQLQGSSATSNGSYVTSSAGSLYISCAGTNAIGMFTNGQGGTRQFNISHTASAVNYVQVTGSATGNRTTISSQGSDTNIGMSYNTKGSSGHIFNGNAGSNTLFNISGAASSANYLQVAPSATTVAPSLSAQGSDTNIDLSLTPKGTGLVRFGTYVAGALTATGYINIKAADGTTYKVLVST